MFAYRILKKKKKLAEKKKIYVIVLSMLSFEKKHETKRGETCLGSN